MQELGARLEMSLPPEKFAEVKKAAMYTQSVVDKPSSHRTEKIEQLRRFLMKHGDGKVDAILLHSSPSPNAPLVSAAAAAPVAVVPSAATSTAVVAVAAAAADGMMEDVVDDTSSAAAAPSRPKETLFERMAKKQSKKIVDEADGGDEDLMGNSSEEVRKAGQYTRSLDKVQHTLRNLPSFYMHEGKSNIPSLSVSLTKDLKQSSYTAKGLAEKETSLARMANNLNSHLATLLDDLEAYAVQFEKLCGAQYSFDRYKEEYIAYSYVKNKEEEARAEQKQAMYELSMENDRFREKQEAIKHAKKRKLGSSDPEVKKKSIFDLIPKRPKHGSGSAKAPAKKAAKSVGFDSE
jgi:hypothetical protein